MNKANDRQVAGTHYTKQGAIQHWDVMALLRADYFQGQVTKYISRWKDKNGTEDLRKAQHFLEKYIEHITTVDWKQCVTVTRIMPLKDFQIGVQALTAFTDKYPKTEQQIMMNVMLWKQPIELISAAKDLEEYVDAMEQEEGKPTSRYTNQD